jgi:hypothetical protein
MNPTGKNQGGVQKRKTPKGARLRPEEFRKASTTTPSQARIPSPMDPPGMNLTIAQAMWVHHFSECLNQTEAARRCGYGDGKAAINAGSEMMAHPAVRAAIAAKMTKCAMSVEELLVRTTEIARSTHECIISFDHRDEPYIDLRKVRRLNLWHLVKTIQWTKDGLKVELHSATEAQDRLMKIHGLYQSRMTITHKVDYTKYPHTPQYIALIERVARGEIDDLEFTRQVQALGYEPSDSPPLVIDSESGVPAPPSEDDPDHTGSFGPADGPP